MTDILSDFYYWFLVVFGAFLVISGVIRVFLRIKEQRINNIFHKDLDSDRYLKVIDERIEKTKKANIKEMLLINKAGVLSMKGDLQEAEKILNSIDLTDIPLKFEILFYNNLICNKVYLGKIEEAADLYIENKELLLQGMKYADMSESIKCTVAVFCYFYGEVDGSKQMLTELFSREMPKITALEANYIMGLIEIKEGKVTEGKNRLQNMLDISKNTMFYERIKNELKL